MKYIKFNFKPGCRFKTWSLEKSPRCVKMKRCINTWGGLNGKHPLSRDAPFDSAITVFWEYSSHDINHANTIKPLRSFPQGQHYSNLCSCKHRAYQNDQSSSGFLWLTQTCKSPVSRPVSLGWSVMVTLRLSLTFIYANVWHVELWRMS